ncbi:MAG: hypothetical protein R3Y43_05580 [Alphaproteobacteria bacterium]
MRNVKTATANHEDFFTDWALVQKAENGTADNPIHDYENCEMFAFITQLWRI